MSKWSLRRYKANQSRSEGKCGKVLILKIFRRGELRISGGDWVEWVGRKEKKETWISNKKKKRKMERRDGDQGE
jgi:hypothetical protein